MSQTKAGPLSGLRVMDVSIMAAGPFAGALLGMLGAEVIKVEPPAGDGTRWVMPSQRGMGTNFMAMNVNKKGIMLDLKTEADQRSALALAATCDIFIQNFRVGVIDKLGLGFEAVQAVNPRLIYCAISGFGERGPLARAGCGDPIMQAFSGFAHANGTQGDTAEAFRFTGFLDLSTSSLAVEAILAALLARDSTGRGQKIDISMLESALEMQFSRISELLGTGAVPHPRGSESPGLVPDRAFQSLDHEVFVTVHDGAEWEGFCAAIERPDLVADPRFASNRLRVANRDALHALLAPIFAAKGAVWWLRVLKRNGVACVLAHDMETFRYHQQVVANDMLANLKTRDWGAVTVGGVPWHFSATPCQVTPAPRPGEHTEDILAGLKDPATPPPPPAPLVARTTLEELRVVELADGIAGPYAGLRLGDFGASVIKIERQDGDWLRGAAPTLPGSDTSAAFFELNRGKRSLRLPRSPRAALPLILKLLTEADIFITDWPDADLEELGLAPLLRETFAANPRLIVADISPWGRRGPMRGQKGSELAAQAMAGYTRYLGTQGQPALRLGSDVASVATGIFTAQAVMSALFWRNRTGQGQRVSLSLLNALLTLKSIQLAAQSDPDVYAGPRVAGPTHPPEQGWKTADRPVFFAFGGSVGAEGRPGWSLFIEEMQMQHLLADPRFQKNGKNSTGHGVDVHALKEEYEKYFVHHTATDLVAKMHKYRANAAAYASAEEALAHPQTQTLDILRSVSDGAGHAVRVRAFPARFSVSRPQAKGAAPHLGEHDAAIAAEGGFAEAGAAERAKAAVH